MLIAMGERPKLNQLETELQSGQSSKS